jgi:WD40 repeat protein
MWDGADGADSATSFDTGGTADFATFDEAGARVVVGGRDRELALWDVAAGTCSYHARNVPHDNLDVPVPVWHSGGRFMPGQPNVLASCTGFVQFRLRGEVRLYDVLAKRRPSVRALAPLGDEAVRSIACTPDGRYVLAGAVSGHMARLDVRKNLLPVNRYKGAAGSIRQIAIHPTLPLVASASLDRHVRLYQLEGTGALLQKVYLKQRLTAMMLSAERPPKGAFAAAITSRASADEGEEGDDEDGGDGDNVGAMLGALREVTDEGDEMGDELDEDGDDDNDDDDDDGNAELDGFEEGADEAADDDDEDDEDEDEDEEDEDEDEEDEDDDEEELAPPPPVGNKRKTPVGRTGTAPKKPPPMRVQTAGANGVAINEKR